MPKSKYGEKVLKEATEKVRVQRRLKQKYPQMYEKGWGKTKKRNILQRVGAKLKKTFNPETTVRTSVTEAGLKKAAVQSEKIMRMRGR